MELKQLKSHRSFDGLTQLWEHESSETKTKMKFSTFLPEGKPKGCLIWLSGLTCTEENFITKAGAQRHLADHNLMVICPDTSPRGLNLPQERDSYDFGVGAGFYVDATTADYKTNYRMYSYVNEEIYQIVQNEFAVPADRISISGHSMGGHGAIVLGLRNPTRYRSVSAFAPIANPVVCPWGAKAFKGYLGTDSISWKEYDSTELIQRGARHPRRILIDQGTKDEFLERQLLPDNFLKACHERDQMVDFRSREGYDHSYYFIATFIESHIAFHAEE